MTARAGEALAAWLLTYWLHGTLLLAGAWVLARVVRAPEVREILWRFALFGGLATATVQTVALPTASPLRLLGDRLSPRSAATFPGAVVWEEAELVVRNGVVERATTRRTGGARRFWAGAALAWVGWAAAAAVLRAVRRRRALAALGRSPVPGDDPAARALDALRRRAGLHRRVALTVSDALSAPAAIGWAEVCVPRAAFARLSPEQRDAVLAHELAHLARGDVLWLGLAEWTAVLFPFQPLNRLARRELREAAELLCDDAAVRHTGTPRALAECLAELAASLGGDRRRAVPGVALAERGSPLVRRVRRLLERGEQRESSDARRWSRVLVALGSAATMLATAAFAPGVPAPRTLSAETAVRELGVRQRLDGARVLELRVVRTGGARLRVNAQGAVLDSAAERVELLLPGDRVRVAERMGTEVRKVEMLPPAAGGRPVYRYIIAGRDTAFDADAERLLATVIRTAARPPEAAPDRRR